MPAAGWGPDPASEKLEEVIHPSGSLQRRGVSRDVSGPCLGLPRSARILPKHQAPPCPQTMYIIATGNLLGS